MRKIVIEVPDELCDGCKYFIDSYRIGDSEDYTEPECSLFIGKELVVLDEINEDGFCKVEPCKECLQSTLADKKEGK